MFRRHVSQLLMMAVLCLLLLFLSPKVGALPVDGLYRHELPVANQSDAERNRAYREALQAVMLKLTGETRWLEHAAIRRALDNAGSYVQEVSFRSDAGMLIDVRFSSSQIDELLIAAGIPLWDRNRPSVLVWLTVQGADGQRQILTSDSGHEMLEVIEAFSRRRAVPFLIPVLDLVDRRNLSVDQAWSLDVDAIRAASARYGADSILSGRVLTTPGGQLVGLWQFLFRDRVETFDGFDSDMESYVLMPLERVTATLASHFNIIRSPDQIHETVNLIVEGVSDLSAYAEMMKYLEELAVVNKVELRRLQGEEVELELSLWGSRFQLTEFLSLDRDLQELEPGQEASPGSRRSGTLLYRWTR